MSLHVLLFVTLLLFITYQMLSQPLSRDEVQSNPKQCLQGNPNLSTYCYENLQNVLKNAIKNAIKIVLVLMDIAQNITLSDT